MDANGGQPEIGFGVVVVGVDLKVVVDDEVVVEIGWVVVDVDALGIVVVGGRFVEVLRVV
jgi:hypothetical protein